MATCDIQALLDQAGCFSCLEPQQQAAIRLQLLCEILNNGGGGGGGVPPTRLINTTAPLTGGGDLSANRTIGIPQATSLADGYLAAADWATFNGKVGTSRTISTTAPLTGGGDLSANRTIGIPKATALVDGYLAAADFAAFAGKINGSTSQWISSAAMIPRVTAGPGVNSSQTVTNTSNYDTLDFDPATSEGANFMLTIPNNWNAGTVTARFFFLADSGSGTVTWTLAARALSDNDPMDSAFGTSQSVTKTIGTPGNIQITAATPAITIAGTPTVNTPIQFLVTRDVSDTLAVDARLIGIQLNWTAA